MHGELLIPRGKGPFPGVVMCHGLGTDHRAMRPSAQRLVREGVATLALDFHGHGQSEGVFEGNVARDVVDALDFLRSYPMIDSERIALVGHSMGAGAAIQAATEQKDLCALVSLSSPSDPSYYYEQADDVFATFFAEVGQEEGMVVEYPRDGALPGLGRLQGILSMLWMRIRGYRLRIDLRKGFAGLAKLKPAGSLERMGAFPKLFVHFRGDKLTPYQGALKLYERTKPLKAILLFDGGSHASPLMPGKPREKWITWLVSMLTLQKGDWALRWVR